MLSSKAITAAINGNQYQGGSNFLASIIAVGPTRLGLPAMSASRGKFRLSLFGLAASRESLLLASEMRTSFQFVGFTFYRVDPAWRRLSESERQRGKA